MLERTESLAGRMKQEIAELIEAGTIPPTASSFSELHDYIDANCLGGTEAMMEQMEQGEFIDICIDAIAAVDAWLARGRID